MTDLLSGSLNNLTSPMILFFILGFAATILKSDLEIPNAIGKTLSIYFMMAIGFKGGVELSKTGITNEVLISTLVALGIGLIIPILSFFVLFKILRMDVTNSGAIAAHYGSVSVVTFVTATTFLESSGINYQGYMVGMMALMESPAIFVSILLVRYLQKTKTTSSRGEIEDLVRESLFNASIVLLTGGLIIGFISGERGMEMVYPFFVQPFNGVLALFLLEMGMLAGKRIGEFREVGVPLFLFAIVMPVVNGSIAVLLASMAGLGEGDQVLFAVLSASASYIAAPAAVRLAIPQANPSYYITMSLAITFPFNIIIGIPLYIQIANIL